MAGGKSFRLGQIWCCKRIWLFFPPTRNPRVEEMGPRVTGVGTGHSDVCLAIDRIRDGPPKAGVLLEETVRHVHGEVAGAVLAFRPEARSVHAVLVCNALNFRSRKWPLVKLVVLDLVKSGLLIEVPLEVEAVQVARPVAARAAPPIRVLAERGQLVYIVPRVHVRTGRREVGGAVDVHDFTVERKLARSRLEERHRDLRKERAVGPGQVDNQPIPLDPGA